MNCKAKKETALKGLAGLIEQKKIKLESIREAMKNDLEAFKITSQGDSPAMTDTKKRLAELVTASRYKRIEQLESELRILQSADDALGRISEIAGQHTTIEDPREFNEIWDEAQRPYEVTFGIDFGVECEQNGKEAKDGGE